jgi:peptidyl-prolyl cis-trans isomerase D
MFMTMMRNQSKSIMIKVMIGLIAVVFVFWGVSAIRERPGSKIAYVNGDLISGLEYDAVYREMLDALQKQYKDYWSDNLIEVFQIKQRALDRLIDKRLISQEAAKLGLKITDKEIEEAILAYPAFQINGEFDEGRYRSLLSYNRMEPSDFESGIRLELLGDKINHFIKSFFPLTDEEVLSYYTYQKEKIRIAFVSFKPEEFRGKMEVKEEEKRKYFKENQERYRVPEKIKISYLTFAPSNFLRQVNVTEKEIVDYYDLNQEKYTTPEQVKARHILLKVEANASATEDEKIKEKAFELLKRITGGEDFISLAKAYSQDTSASEGGDLGFFKRGQMVKPFEESAFSLKNGEVSEPVRTKFGWHLIKVEDKKSASVKALTDVRDEIEAKIKGVIAQDLAHERALDSLDQMPYSADISTYAGQLGLKSEETDYFVRGGPIPGIGNDEKLTKSIASLEEGEISEVIQYNGNSYIIQIADIKESYIPEMTEVKEQLDKDFEEHLSLLAAKNTAEHYLEELRSGANWSEFISNKGLEVEETEFFSREETTPKIGYAPELSEAIFSLSPEKRYPDKVFEVNNKIYIVRWLTKKGIDKEVFDKEKQAFKQRLIMAKEKRIFDAWLQSIKRKAEIKMVTPL